MHFCSICGLVMTRDTSTGAVRFVCVCGEEKMGAPLDARLFGAIASGETVEMYRTMIDNAAFDRTNQRVLRLCSACGLDYQIQIRVGASETIVYKCKCGNETMGIHDATTTGGGPASEEPASEEPASGEPAPKWWPASGEPVLAPMPDVGSREAWLNLWGHISDKGAPDDEGSSDDD